MILINKRTQDATPEARLPSDGLQGGGDCKTPRRQVPAQDFYHISFGAIEC